METLTYNGWANRQTWNVALWIGNDEPLYRSAVEFMESYEGDNAYTDFIEYVGLESDSTPDGVQWINSKLNLPELNRMMEEYKN
jgi:hypothetical protein